MRYIDVEDHAYKVYEKFTYQMSINMGRMTTTQGAHARLLGIHPFFSLSLLVKSFEEEIKPSGDSVDTARG